MGSSASQMAKDVIGSLSVRDKIFLFIHRNKHQRLRSTAIGIIWNRCVRELAKVVFLESVENEKCILSSSCSENEWNVIMNEAFRFLTLDNIDKLEFMLKELTLYDVLELDMPSEAYKINFTSNGGSEGSKSSLA